MNRRKANKASENSVLDQVALLNQEKETQMAALQKDKTGLNFIMKASKNL